MRLLYGGLGLSVVGQAVAHGQWFLLVLGAYFMLAAVFGWGCAGSRCAVPHQKIESNKKES